MSDRATVREGDIQAVLASWRLAEATAAEAATLAASGHEAHETELHISALLRWAGRLLGEPADLTDPDAAMNLSPPVSDAYDSMMKAVFRFESQVLMEKELRRRAVQQLDALSTLIVVECADCNHEDCPGCFLCC